LPKPAHNDHPSGVDRFFPAAAAQPMALAAALFLLAALVIGWPWLSGRMTIPWDAKAHFQPQIQFVAQSLARRPGRHSCSAAIRRSPTRSP
jgi:hypothetical protein